MIAYKRLLRTMGISEQSTLLCEQKLLTSRLPVRRTGSYRHKKALIDSFTANLLQSVIVKEF